MTSEPKLPAHLQAPEPSTFRLIGTLGLAGLLSGLVLVGVYEITQPRIRANKARALREAVFEVLPGTRKIQKLAWTDGSFEPVSASPSSGGSPSAIFAGYDARNHLVGYAIPGEGAGFQDTIRVIYGYDPERRRIVGFQVLQSRETPGLGDKIYKDPDFQENFRDLAVEPEIVPAETRTADNEVDTITGATISSVAVVEILNQSNETWLDRLPPPGEEPWEPPAESAPSSGGAP